MIVNFNLLKIIMILVKSRKVLMAIKMTQIALSFKNSTVL